MPLIRRMGRPGLLGLAARTAVVAGTASAVSGGMARRSETQATEDAERARYEQQQQQQVDQAAAAAAARYQAAAPAPAGGAGLIDELQKLSTLHAQGALDDAEYAAAKAKLLA